MFKDSPFIKLALKIGNDLKYQHINDPLERILYLIRKQKLKIKNISEEMLKQCSFYEKQHEKSEKRVEQFYEQISEQIIALEQLKKSNNYVKHKEQEMVAKMWSTFDSIIRSLPYDWSDWETMFRLMMTFTDRARLFFENKLFEQAYNDLYHVSIICKQFHDQDLMIEHLTDQIDSLALIVALKLHLIKPLENHGVETRLFKDWFSIFNLNQSIMTIVQPDIEKMASILAQLNIPTLLSIMDLFDKHFQHMNPDSIKFNNDKVVNLIVNPNIQICRTDHGGRQYRTTNFIQPNEILLFERPQMTILFNNMILEFCFHCCCRITTQWPCFGCDEIVFCSYECSRLAWKLYHEKECRIYGMIVGKNKSFTPGHVYRQFSFFGLDMINQCEREFKKQKQKSKLDKEIGTVSRKLEDSIADDYIQQYIQSKDLHKKCMENWNEQDLRILCRAMISLVYHQGNQWSYDSYHVSMAIRVINFLIYKRIVPKSVIDNETDFSYLIQNVSISLSRVCMNGFCYAIYNNNPDTNEIKTIRVASCVSIGASMFNHSCMPNVIWQLTNNGITLKSLRSIHPGELLTISYGPTAGMDFNLRQILLRESYHFFCRCELCLVDVAKSKEIISMQCPSQPNQCSGPLVLNKFESCLVCGYQHRNFYEQYKSLEKMKKSRRKFNNTMGSIIEYISTGNRRRKFLTFGQCNNLIKSGILPPAPGIIKKFDMERLLNMIDLNNIQSISEPNWNKIDRKLNRLTEYFETYSQIAWPGSFDFLKKYTQFICIQQVLNYDVLMETLFIELKLADLLHQCLDSIYPNALIMEDHGNFKKEQDSILIPLVTNLNYLCRLFFEYYFRFDDNVIQSIKQPDNYHHHHHQEETEENNSIRNDANFYEENDRYIFVVPTEIKNEQGGDNEYNHFYSDKTIKIISDKCKDNLIYQSKFFYLMVRLNQILQQILYKDMHEVGYFFPKLYENFTEYKNDYSDEPCIDDILATSITTATKKTTKLLRKFCELRLSESEKNYKIMYEDCQRRLSKLFTDDCFNLNN